MKKKNRVNMNKPEGLADAKKHIKRYKNKMGKIRH